MSDVDGTCEYVLDPADPETWGGEEGDECYVDEEVLNEDGVWTCPHDAEEEKDLCIFHTLNEEKTEQETTEKFVNEISKDDRESQFIGGKFDSLLIDIDGVTNKKIKINIKHSKFSGQVGINYTNNNISILASGSSFRSGLELGELDIHTGKFEGVTFRGSVNFTSTIFQNNIKFSSSQFEEFANFEAVNFNCLSQFHETQFNAGACFEGVCFQEKRWDGAVTAFMKTKFNDLTTFNHSKFKGYVNFEELVCSGEIVFNDAVFEGKPVFEDSIFFDSVEFKNVEFLSESSFEGVEFQDEVSFIGSDFQDKSIFDYSEFNNVKFSIEMPTEIWESAEDTLEQSDIDKNNVNFISPPSFVHTEMTEAHFLGVDLSGANFSNANLTDSTLANANLQSANLETSKLSRATLFGTDLRGARISGAVLGDARIDENTQFLGHPSDDVNGKSSIWDTFSELRSGNYCIYDPRYEGGNNDEDIDSAKSVYRALEELAGRAARPQLQSTCFVNRQDLQRDQYWGSIGNSDNPLEWVINSGKWSRAKVAQKTLLYGESPWRVIGWSLGIILSFALLYPLGGWMKPTDGNPITYAQVASNPAEILNSVYYSTLTYTALGFGDFQPVGIGRLLTTVETGLGAVMLALLVFILGRRAAR